MIPIAFGLAKLFVNLINSNPELGKIEEDHIYKDLLIKYFKKDNEKVIKQKITKNINILIANYKSFKIGKSGIPKSRAENQVEFKEMFLLCESKYPDLIENLETYYNEKYFNHPKNKNINKGSAAKMSEIDGNYYLYIAVK